MKKSSLLSLKTVILLIVFISGTAALGVWYVRYLGDVVTARFEGRKWPLPSKIYSDTFLLYVGMNLRREDLWEKLRRLDYRESQGAPDAKGE